MFSQYFKLFREVIKRGQERQRLFMSSLQDSYKKIYKRQCHWDRDK